MKSLPRKVDSNQSHIHEDLELLIRRYSIDNYGKPIADFSYAVFNQIKSWSKENHNNNLILDIGCGVGESSYHLGLKYPNYLIVGIDKSQDRISRNNSFKKSLPTNVKLFRADAIDLWLLFYKNINEFNIIKQYILYPNPWPLKHHYKKRWQGHPIFPFILELDSEIEVRSNWKLYLDEFEFMLKKYEKNNTRVERFSPEKTITPFERKYFDSSQDLYRLSFKPLN